MPSDRLCCPRHFSCEMSSPVMDCKNLSTPLVDGAFSFCSDGAIHLDPLVHARESSSETTQPLEAKCSRSEADGVHGPVLQRVEAPTVLWKRRKRSARTRRKTSQLRTQLGIHLVPVTQTVPSHAHRRQPRTMSSDTRSRVAPRRSDNGNGNIGNSLLAKASTTSRTLRRTSAICVSYVSETKHTMSINCSNGATEGPNGDGRPPLPTVQQTCDRTHHDVFPNSRGARAPVVSRRDQVGRVRSSQSPIVDGKVVSVVVKNINTLILLVSPASRPTLLQQRLSHAPPSLSTSIGPYQADL